jgi:hypothetical protein
MSTRESMIPGFPRRLAGALAQDHGGSAQMDPADLWDLKVSEGMSADEATEYVSRIHGPPPAAEPIATEGAPEPQRGDFLASTAGVPNMASEEAETALLNIGQGGTAFWGDDARAAVKTGLGRLRGPQGTGQRGDGLASLAGVPNMAAMPTEGLRESFNRNLTTENERLEEYRRENPGRALLGEVAGGVAAAALTGGAVRPAPPTVGRLLGTGAAVGGIAGAGASEGDLVERAKAGAGGAVVGAATAGTLRLGQKGGEIAGDLIPGFRTKVAGAASRLTAPLRQGDAPLPEGAELRYTGGPFAGLSRRLRGPDGFTGTEGGPIRSVDERADDLLVEAIERSGKSLDELIAEAESGTLPETIMELAGQPVQRLARGAHAIPSRGSAEIERALVARKEQQLPRLKGEFEEALGLTEEDVFATVDDLLATRRANARQMYPEAYRAQIDDPATLQMLDDEVFEEAHALARKYVQREGGEAPPLFRLVERDGEQVKEYLPQPVEILDVMKQSLDDVIERRRAGGKMARREGRWYRNRLNDLLGRVDEAVPDYAAARAQYANDSGMLRAMRIGTGSGLQRSEKSFLQMDPREVQRLTATMDDDAIEFFRRGAFDAIRRRMEKTADGRDLTRVVFGNPEMRARVRALFGSEDEFADFARLMEREREIARTPQFVLGGSPTARIEAEKDQLAGDAIKAAAGEPGRLLGRLTDWATNKAVDTGILRGMEARADALAPRLTAGASGNRQDVVALLQRLREAAGRATEREGRRESVRRGAAAVGGGLLGRQ